MSNCVFNDEAAFHVNIKRTFAWSKVGRGQDFFKREHEQAQLIESRFLA